MQKLIRTVVLLLLLSSAEGAQSPTVSSDTKEPWAVLSKDSAVFFFPLDTEADWSWNVLPEDSLEYMRIARFTWPDGQGRSDIGLRKLSSGGEKKTGGFEELLQKSRLREWVGSAGEQMGKRRPPSLIHTEIVQGGMLVKMPQFRDVERLIGLGADSVTFMWQEPGRPRREQLVEIVYAPDEMEQRAREISGPLSPDEYAVYQTVLSRPHQNIGVNVVLSPTLNASHEMVLKVLKNMHTLEQETRDNFIQTIPQVADLNTLSQLDFTVLDADSFDAEVKNKIGKGEAPRASNHMRVSRVGFNETRNEAVVYLTYHCGFLCAEGLLISLEFRRGSWYIVNRRMVWIS
jgi:hypothetical protein